jgi:hypothetical protein
VRSSSHCVFISFILLAAAPFVHDGRIAYLFLTRTPLFRLPSLSLLLSDLIPDATTLLLRNPRTCWVGRIDGYHSRRVLELYAGTPRAAFMYGYPGVASIQ